MGKLKENNGKMKKLEASNFFIFINECKIQSFGIFLTQLSLSDGFSQK